MKAVRDVALGSLQAYLGESLGRAAEAWVFADHLENLGFSVTCRPCTICLSDPCRRTTTRSSDACLHAASPGTSSTRARHFLAE